MYQKNLLALFFLLVASPTRVFATITKNLFSAIVRGDIDQVKNLLLTSENKAAINAQQNHSRRTALHCAARCGHSNIVDHLIIQGAAIEAQDNEGRTALHIASERGHESVVQCLLTHNSKANAQDSLNQTPLHMASRSGHTGVVRMLINAKAQINALHRHGYTPLHLATLVGHTAIVTILLNASAYTTNASAPRATTPLHIAACLGKIPIATLLLEAGASVDDADGEDNTPLEAIANLLKQEKSPLLKETACLLASHGACINQKVITALQSSSQNKLLERLRAHHKTYQEAIKRFHAHIMQQYTIPKSIANLIIDLITGPNNRKYNLQ